MRKWARGEGGRTGGGVGAETEKRVRRVGRGGGGGGGKARFHTTVPPNS